MIKLFAFFLCFTATSVWGGSPFLDSSDHVGVIYPPMLKNCVDSGSTRIGDGPYWLAYVDCNDEHLLWVTKLADPNAPPSIRPIRWLVVSSTAIGDMQPGHSIADSHSGCVSYGRPSDFTVAVVTWDDDRQQATNIIRAWAFSQSEASFTAVDSSKVFCGYSEDRD